jgi:hypothetical protein
MPLVTSSSVSNFYSPTCLLFRHVLQVSFDLLLSALFLSTCVEIRVGAIPSTSVPSSRQFILFWFSHSCLFLLVGSVFLLVGFFGRLTSFILEGKEGAICLAFSCNFQKYHLQVSKVTFLYSQLRNSLLRTRFSVSIVLNFAKLECLLLTCKVVGCLLPMWKISTSSLTTPTVPQFSIESEAHGVDVPTYKSLLPSYVGKGV